MRQRSKTKDCDHGVKPRFRWTAILLPVLVAIMAFAAFYPALEAEFVNYDDNKLFLENTSYRGFDAARLKWMFTTTFMGHYQPLTWLSSALDYRISGLDPVSYHCNNLILHALNALLLYFVALRLFRAALRLEPDDRSTALRMAAAAAALLFAVHPLRVESVAWASERRDVLSLFFLLSALWAYLRAFQPERVAIDSWACYLASWALLLLSLLSKAWGMSFALVVLVLDVYPLRRLPPNVSQWFSIEHMRIWLQKIPYLILGLVAAIRAGQAQHTALGTMASLDEWGLTERFVQAFYGLAFYVWKTVWPTHLVALYELPYRLNPFELKYVISFLAVTTATVVAILLRRRWPAILAATVIYVIIVTPVLGLIQSGHQFVADKYSYVCCIAWAVLIAGGLLSAWRRRRVFATAGVSTIGLVIIILFVCTWRQTGVWHDSKRLWRHALTAGSPSAAAHLNYGILLRKDGDIAGAIDNYRQAVTIRPDNGNAWYALANALKQTAEYAEAEEAYRMAVDHMVEKHRAYFNLGNMYYNNMRRVEDSVAAYRAAIAHMEQFRDKMFTPWPYLALGIALRDQGGLAEARRMFLEARRHSETKARAESELTKLSGGE